MRVSTPSFKLASLAMLTILAACGGGGGDSGSGNVSSTPQTSGSTATAPGAPAAPGNPPARANADNGTNGAIINGKPAPGLGLGGTVGAGVAPQSGTGITQLPVPTPSPTLKAQGIWSPLMDWPVISIHAALTPDGRVMTFGVDYSSRNDNKFYYDVWDPTKGTGPDSHMVLPNQTNTFLFCAAQVLVPTTGELLILGGDLLKDGKVTNTGVKDVNLFNPADNSLKRATNAMQLPRWYGTATTLPSGEIYIQGGTSGEEHPEVRNLDGTFRLLDGIDTLATYGGGAGNYFDNNYPRNFVAPNGKVFGFDPHYMYEVDPKGKGTVKMYGAHWDIPHSDPAEAAKNPDFYRGWSATSATAMIRPGLILQFGGSEPRATLIDINGAKPVLTDLPKLKKVYHWSNATILPDGNVLVSGGSTKNLLLDTVEPINEDAGEINYDAMIFNPESRTWMDAGKFNAQRLYHSTTLLLQDGTVLSTGGGAPGPVHNLNAQVYQPGYLFNADGTLAKRPALEGTDGALPLVVEPGGTFSVGSADALDIDKVTLIKTGAVTHSFDMEQRFNQLEFKADGAKLDITLPANKFLTPPGYYMVFALNKAGVPSKGRIIRINPSANP
ncbi:MAG: galactose oxidase early set domain-containing protein [Lautropia sp.]|nr:galactose oxidase early set domain-containing protein [Lautropia sp.]